MSETLSPEERLRMLADVVDDPTFAAIPVVTDNNRKLFGDDLRAVLALLDAARTSRPPVGRERVAEIVEAAIKSQPYTPYCYVAQNGDVERHRATKYARAIARRAILEAPSHRGGDHERGPWTGEGEGLDLTAAARAYYEATHPSGATPAGGFTRWATWEEATQCGDVAEDIKRGLRAALAALTSPSPLQPGEPESGGVREGVS